MIYLSFWETLKEKLFSFNWGNLVAFLIGIVIGFILCLLSYLLIVLVDLKKEESKAKKVVIKVDNKIIEDIIKNEKNRYKLESANLPASGKVLALRDSCSNLILDIARTYYPESKHPVFEISIEELMALDYYIMEKLEKIFNRRVIKRIKGLRLVKVLNTIDKTKKVTDNKVVKATSKQAKGFWKVVNIINPVYWGKKAVTHFSINILMNKIVLVIIDIVGNETSRVYSKGIFVKDDDEYIEEVLSGVMEEEDEDE